MRLPSPEFVAAAYLASQRTARSRTPWESFADFFRTSDEVFRDTYENEIKLTQRFFAQLREYATGKTVRELVALYQSFEDSGTWDRNPRELVQTVIAMIRYQASFHLKKFDPEVRAELDKRDGTKRPDQILMFLSRMEALADHASQGSHVPLFLKTLGVPLEAFRAASRDV